MRVPYIVTFAELEPVKALIIKISSIIAIGVGVSIIASTITSIGLALSLFLLITELTKKHTRGDYYILPEE
jgi:hypothetical protein